jgi:predicted RNase H-like nuclease (RuvC/YqgF family)
MPRTGISPEQITAAAEALVAEGVEPTSSAVREKLGGGSFSTICATLKTWRADRAEARQIAGTPLPEAVQVQLSILGGNVWAAALAVAEANLAPQREALAKEKAEAEATVADFQAAIEKLETNVENLEAAVVKAEAAKDKAEALREETLGKLTEASRVNGSLQSQLEAAQKQAAKLEEVNRKQEAKITELKAAAKSKPDAHHQA